MAVYGDQVLLPGVVAGASLASDQYKVLKWASTAGQVIVVTATTSQAIGILQNDPASGEAANVALSGVSKAIAGTSNIAVGDALGFDSTGRVVVHTTDNRRMIGRALEASAATGDLVQIHLIGLTRF